MMRIYPSLMAADQLNLEKEIEQLKNYCSGFHLDVMDNHYVPNMTWGVATVNAIAEVAQVWVHLMIDKPLDFYIQLELKAESLVSFHIESNVDFFYASKLIREKKHRFSIVISPKTAVSIVVPFLGIVDQIVVMTVDPGFSGQSFLSGALDRIDELLEYRQKSEASFRIGVDGGVDINNIATLVKKGIDDYVIGSAIFKNKNSLKALQEFNNLLQ